MTVGVIELIDKDDLSTSSFSNNNSHEAGGIAVRVDAGSTVGNAISAAIAALPGDKYLQGLASYAAATNILTLNMSDGSTVAVNLTGLVNDAVAEATAAATVEVRNNAGAVIGKMLPP